MHPNDRRALPAILRGIIASTAIGSPLHAHNVLRTNGQVVLESNRLVVTFDVSPEDFGHLYGLAPTADGTVPTESIHETAGLHADELTASFELWNEAGLRLDGEPFRWNGGQQTSPTAPWAQLRAMRIRYSASFDLPPIRVGGLTDRPRLLTFRMNPSGLSVALARQWVIDVAGPDVSVSQTVHLTSRGNAETVELQWVNSAPRLRATSNVPNEKLVCAPPEDRQAARFREIFVDAEKTSEGLSVHTTVPLALLNTWIPVQRRVEGRVEPDEQGALLLAAQTLMRSSLDIKGDGKSLSADSFGLRVIGAHSRLMEKSEAPEPVGYFTSHLEIRQHYGTAQPVKRLTFGWRLLNSAVFTARVAFRTNGQCTAGEFSTYTPTLEW